MTTHYLNRRELRIIREFLRRLNSHLTLTKQERTVVIFLVVSLLIGNSVLFLKRRKGNFAKDLVTSERPTLDELIEASDSLLREGKKYIKMDINSANPSELGLLPGVGPALARRIIEYRNKFGPFKTPEELMKVKGIGEIKYEGLKDCIIIGRKDKEQDQSH